MRASAGVGDNSRHESKSKLLAAALRTIREKGYEATRIDDVCAAAGLTKGSFFHHFKSKEELALASIAYWNEMTSALFAAADYHALPDPLDRLFAYLDLRKQLLAGELPDVTCLAGMMAQEVYVTHPAIRDACGASIADHASTLVADFEAALHRHRVTDATADSLARYTQAVLQGAFILAKAGEDAQIAADCIDQLHRHLELLFKSPRSQDSRSAELA